MEDNEVPENNLQLPDDRLSKLMSSVNLDESYSQRSFSAEPDVSVGNDAAEEQSTPDVVDSTVTTSLVSHDSQEPRALSQLFSEDCSGGDVEGKAFFDVLASSLPSSGATSEPTEKIVVSSVAVTGKQVAPSVAKCSTRDAWICTKEAKDAFERRARRVFEPDARLLTNLRVMTNEEFGDPIRDYVAHYCPDHLSKRTALTVNDVPQTEDGLRQLLVSQCWNAALNLTARLLRDAGHEHSAYSLQLWFIRFGLLVKVKRFKLADQESDAFENLDKPDMFYQFYPDSYPGKKGSMAPFSLRLLLAQLPSYVGRGQEAMDRLTQLLAIVKQIEANIGRGFTEDGEREEIVPEVRQEAERVWRERHIRVLYVMLNCSVEHADFRYAVHCCQQLITLDTTKTAHLYTALGRVHLQMGDLSGAEENFRVATKHYSNSGLDGKVDTLLNSALVAVACNNYAEACRLYEEARALRPKNPVLMNNMAICMLHMGRLREALETLEKAIYSEPTFCIHEGLVFNMCTLYELLSAAGESKKLQLLQLINARSGDGFSVESLKLAEPPAPPLRVG